MSSSVDACKFNDDLLLHDSDRKLAEKLYPTIYHVLDHPELRLLFSTYDKPADRAKRAGLRAGVWAIALGLAALAIASLEIAVMPAFGNPSDPQEWIGLVLAPVSALCLLGSVLIGSFGLLFARRKRDWLHARLMGESIRQFHFQTLVFRQPQILSSLKDIAAKAAFIRQRTLWFESFQARLAGHLDAVFAAMIQEERDIDPWHDSAKPRGPARLVDSKELDPLFDAYRQLRIMHQLAYANYKLQDDHRLISTMPRRQLAIVSQAAFVWIILLIGAHVLVLAGTLFPASIFGLLHSPGGIVAIIWCALAALATRTLEQGLQPEREIERYQQYRSAVRAILERYDQASSQAEKVEIMREMERLAMDEMRNFLITNERSRFVM